MNPVNPADFLINLKGKPYLPVAGRIAIIRGEAKPYSIKTTPLQIDMEAGFAIFQAEVWLDGILLGMGTKQESKRDFPDFLEKAETGAIGRALAISGFGTIYALQDFDEGERLADAPVTVNKPKGPVGDMGDSEYPISNHFKSESRKPSTQPAPQPAPPPAAPDPVKALSVEFKDEVSRFDGKGVGPTRLKQVFAIVTQNGDRTPENLRLAIDTVRACETPDNYEFLLRSMGTGENAPF